MDLNGSGTLVESNKLHICMNLRPDVYTFDKFRYMCIISGCDYLESLPGIGLKKALKFITLTADTNIYNVNNISIFYSILSSSTFLGSIKNAILPKDEELTSNK